MSAAAFAVRQVVYENKAFWRNPPAAFFTFAFPLMFLVIFNVAFGREAVSEEGRRMDLTTAFIAPAIVTFAVINSTFTNIAISISYAKDAGLLKRVRGTPLPAAAFLGGKMLHAIGVMVVLVATTIAFGAVFYDAAIPSNTLPGLVLSLVVGAASFCALGLAITAAIPNGDASPAIVNATVLPLLFFSDVFFRIEDPPSWVAFLRTFTPVSHLRECFATAFNPFTQGAGLEWGHLAVVALWGLAGLLLAARFFSWEPKQ